MCIYTYIFIEPLYNDTYGKRKSIHYTVNKSFHYEDSKMYKLFLDRIIEHFEMSAT